jgi:hypothetical protein
VGTRGCFGYSVLIRAITVRDGAKPPFLKREGLLEGGGRNVGMRAVG